MKLVFIENNRPVTDSLTVAGTFGKEHRRVLQDIRELECSEEFRLHNFVQSSYTNDQNREMPRYLITQDGFAFLVMGYTGKEAARFKEMYINEFNRMRELYQNQFPVGLSKEMQAIFMLDKRTQEFESRIEKLEHNITIDYGQQNDLQVITNQSIVSLLGGKESPAYQNSKLRGEAYSAIWRDFKGYFNINSYKNTLVKDFDKAKQYLYEWSPQGKLLRDIERANGQIQFE
ncbi:Rha family transcriptional regulator [Paenibacillus sp. EPM92]|uniref:Rha family transcriptional regulator n=1 Tax=Paenibacillus sp. EPM92 TaxID=1561195 RepID=UPI0019153FC0|nr:Rha family transcriptional regulator [Paenibacillus sp. EPM92]